MSLSRESRGGMCWSCWLVVYVRRGLAASRSSRPADAAAGIEAWPRRGSPAAGPDGRRGDRSSAVPLCAVPCACGRVPCVRAAALAQVRNWRLASAGSGVREPYES
jgi:hypothetical protein